MLFGKNTTISGYRKSLKSNWEKWDSLIHRYQRIIFFIDNLVKTTVHCFIINLKTQMIYYYSLV